MNLDNTQQAIYTWMQRETGLPADKVIFAEQSEHRPNLPYATIKFVNPGIRVGSIDELRVEGETFTTAGLRTALVSLNIFGKGANDLMSALRDSLDRPDVVDEFEAAEIAHIGENGPNDLTELMETKYQERSQLDLTIQYAQVRATSVVPIEHVVIENEILDETIEINIP